MQDLQRLYFEFSPEALLVINIQTAKIEQLNRKAMLLFGENPNKQLSTNTDITSLFKSSWADFVVFSEAIKDKGEAWNQNLKLQNAEQSLAVRVTGRLIPEHNNLIVLQIIPLKALQQQNSHTEIEKLHRQGLAKWQSMQSFFSEFEQTNSLILNAVGEGVYGVDNHGLATFFNPAAESLLGWQYEEVLGKNMHHLIHHSHKDGSHYHQKSCHIFSALYDGKTKHVYDEYFWCKNGTAIPVEYTSTPIIENGQILGAVVVFRDISERKKSEQAVKSALEQVHQLKQKLELENQYLIESYKQEHNFSQIIDRSHEIHKIIQKIAMVSRTNANVLITGESGTGKELIAQAIHDYSPRKSRPLIRVNCASIPKDLFESEFFGHTKGAFTGAISDRVGRFELADGGTLFLDEIGEIPYELQSKLLRVLQEQKFERIGDSKTRNINVRIIAATNRDLLQEVQEKRFREDLYFRLNVFPIESPPLRNRLEDIPLLAEHFLKLMCEKHNRPRLPLKVKHMQLLQNYSWPGNIRELVHVMERAVIISQDQLILDPLQNNQTINKQKLTTHSVAEEVMSYSTLKSLEKQNIIKALQHCHGKIFGQDSASELLGINPTTLNSKLKKFKINKYEYKSMDEN